MKAADLHPLPWTQGLRGDMRDAHDATGKRIAVFIDVEACRAAVEAANARGADPDLGTELDAARAAFEALGFEGDAARAAFEALGFEGDGGLGLAPESLRRQAEEFAADLLRLRGSVGLWVEAIPAQPIDCADAAADALDRALELRAAVVRFLGASPETTPAALIERLESRIDAKRQPWPPDPEFWRAFDEREAELRKWEALAAAWTAKAHGDEARAAVSEGLAALGACRAIPAGVDLSPAGCRPLEVPARLAAAIGRARMEGDEAAALRGRLLDLRRNLVEMVEMVEQGPA